jgi:hypothetical protein
MAIKVRVLRGVQAGLTGMSGLVALSSGVTACTAEQGPGDESFESDESALTIQNPGTGVFSLGWDYATPLGYSMSAKNSVDEYVRAGEKMTFAIPANFLWQRLYPNLGMPDAARLKQLSAKVKIIYVKADGVYANTSVSTNNTFTGSQSYDLAVLTNSFIVSKRATGLRFELTISDAADTTKKASVVASDLNEIPVIGGTLPNKTALFDNNGPTLRQRILEGGKPVAGGNLAIGYTDWRAATVVDSSSVDRTIGNATSFGRFGSFQMPINGELQHEITYAAAIDGAWQAEQALTANAKSKLLSGYGRVAYEGNLALPGTAKNLEIYFHVKTFLVVDYSKFSNVGWRKYQQGERILVREKWDNEHGAYADNYDFATEAK